MSQFRLALFLWLAAALMLTSGLAAQRSTLLQASPTPSPTMVPQARGAAAPLLLSIDADGSMISVRHSGDTLPAGATNEIGFWYRQRTPALSSWTYLGTASYRPGQTVSNHRWPRPAERATYEIAARLRYNGTWQGDFLSANWPTTTETLRATPTPVRGQLQINSVSADPRQITATHSGQTGGADLQYIGFWYRQTLPTAGPWSYLGLVSYRPGETTTSTPWPTPVDGRTYQLATRLRIDGQWSGDYVYGQYVAPGGPPPTTAIPFKFDSLTADQDAILVTHNGVIDPPGSRNFVAVWYRETAPSLGAWKYLGFVEYSAGETVTKAPWMAPDPRSGANYELAARRWNGQWATPFLYGSYQTQTPVPAIVEFVQYDNAREEIVALVSVPGTIDTEVGFWYRPLTAFEADPPAMTEATGPWVFLGRATVRAGGTEARLRHQVTTIPEEIAVAVFRPGSGWGEFYLNIAPEGETGSGGGDAYPRLHSAWVDFATGEAGAYFDVIGDQDCGINFYIEELDPETCNPITTEVLLGRLNYKHYQRRINEPNFFIPPTGSNHYRIRLEYVAIDADGRTERLISRSLFNPCEPKDLRIETEIIAGDPNQIGGAIDVQVRITNNRSGQIPASYALRHLYPNTLTLLGVNQVDTSFGTISVEQSFFDTTRSFVHVISPYTDNPTEANPILYVMRFQVNSTPFPPYNITVQEIPGTPIPVRDTSNQPILFQYDWTKTASLEP